MSEDDKEPIFNTIAELAGDDEARRQATVAWARERSDTGLEKLFAALGDDSWRVRKAALDGLIGYHPHPRLVPTLVQGLQSSENAGLRNASAEALIKLGEVSVPDLLNQVASPDPDLRKFAIDILGDIRMQAAAPKIIDALADLDENVRAAAAEALGKIGGDTATKALWNIALNSPDLLLKLSALESLAVLEAPGDFDRLQDIYKNRFLSKPALSLLGCCPDPRAPLVLAAALTESAKSLRSAALQALMHRLRGMRQDEQQVLAEALQQRRANLLEALSEFLHSNETNLVRGAMKVLAMLGEPQVARSILEAVKGERLIDAAESALLALGPAALVNIAEALPWISEEARELAASVLAVRGDARAMRVLVGTLLRGEQRTREIAARVLARIGGEDIIDELIGSLAEAKDGASVLVEEVLRGMIARQPAVVRKRLSSVVAGAQRSLGAGLRLFALVAMPEDAPMLQQYSKHEKPEVRAAAVSGLARLDAPEAHAALLLALSDEVPRVRELAAQGLKRFSDDEVLSGLLVAASDEDVQVATAATVSIGHFDAPAARAELSNLTRSERAPIVIAATRGLAVLDPERAFKLLPDLLGHADKEVVKEATRVVLPLKPLEASAHFEALLSSPYWDVRFVAVQVLAALPSSTRQLERHAKVEEDALVLGELQKVLGGKTR